MIAGDDNTKIAFVSGGSRGIGKAVSLQLAQDGYDIAFCYRNDAEAAQNVKNSIEKLGRRVCCVHCDVSDFDQVKASFDTISDELGDVSVIVNNAGITADMPLAMMKPEDWRLVLDTNLSGVFNVCRCASLSLIRNGDGAVINFSSVSGVYGNAGQTNYSAAKAGIIGFSKSLSRELGRYGIRVNVVAPGLIDTDMVSGMDDKARNEILNRIVLNRIGYVEDIANLVSFLCSDKASYITSQTIQVDGGLLA